ncbi:hypothetical protein PHA8399_00356 [Leisingera aquaemixtae]|uniref:Uncharacterized protein n=1 Tax=Leisingera aquaemixtae TaxID=1396826 RepID=A0A0P1H632_9RHOB|nr:hypothetical protein PHA8399_00356 [Leisingera aquaemixtae]
MKMAAYQISQWVRIAWRLGWKCLTDAGDMPQKIVYIESDLSDV